MEYVIAVVLAALASLAIVLSSTLGEFSRSDALHRILYDYTYDKFVRDNAVSILGTWVLFFLAFSILFSMIAYASLG